MTDTADKPAAETRTDMREKAIELAELGYPVFRLEPNGKLPIEKNFPAIACTDPETVKHMWTDAFGEPSNHNIGILTGRGFVAVDYDAKNGKPGLQFRDKFDSNGMPTSIRMATPTGGEHLILSTPKDLIIGSSVEKIAPGVDTRGRNSYIVGPGSVTENGEYTWLHKHPLKDADPVPDFFMPELLKHSRYSDTPKETQPLCDLDEPSSVDRAIKYLQNNAPKAVEGEAGDFTTFTVAAQLAEWAISEEFAFDLMAEHWNEQKADPPWDHDELKRKVANAYKYSQTSHGVSSAHVDFEAVEIDESSAGIYANTMPSNPDWPSPTVIRPFEPSDIPEREFLYKEGLFAKRTVTALVAPSGAGKTQFLIQSAAGGALNLPINGLTPIKPFKTWLWNQEDDDTELKRRLAATLIHHDKDVDDLDNRVALNSGVDHRLTLVAKDKSGRLRTTKHVQTLINQIKRTRTDLFIVDPLVEFHEAEENDNVQMAYVAGVLRRIAVEADCSVVIGHHDRKPDTASSKGHQGNQNAMRGASSLQGVTRAILTLYTMNEQDAKALKVEEGRRHRYVRLDGAKNNLGLAGGKPVWLERVGQKLHFDATQEVGVLAIANLDRRGVIREVREADVIAKAIGMCKKTFFRKGWVNWGAVLTNLSQKSVWSVAEYRTTDEWNKWLKELSVDELEGSSATIQVVKGGKDEPHRVRVKPVESTPHYDFME